MKKIGKTIAVFSLALIAALCLGITASAELWGEEVILEYAEYCKTHSYKQQIAMYFEMFQADDGGGSTSFFTEEEFLRIKNGENALIVVDYELSDEVFDWVGEPQYNLSFPILMSDGREINSGYRPKATCLHRLVDRNVFTVREHLLEGGVENETDKIIFIGLDTADGYISGYDFKGYTFIPCENGWNEIDGARYYVKKDGTLATSSLIIGGIGYQFGKDGVCQGKYTGFTKSDKGKRYWKDGKLLKNERFKTKNGRRYYADKNGYLTEVLTLVPRDPDLPLNESDDLKVDFDEAVSQSYTLVRAKCVGLTEQTRDKRVYCFTRSETVTGGSMPYLFYVTVSEYNHGVEDAPGYESTDIHYKEDTEYLLPLRKRSSVFEENDVYYAVGDAVIPIGKDGVFENPTIQGRSIEGLTRLDQLPRYLSGRNLTCGQAADEIGTKFTRSDDLAEVVNSSDYILDVTVSDLFSKPFYGSAEDRTTYICTVNEVLKAGNKRITNVYAALPKDGAQIGGRYLLLLNRTSGASYVYVVSSFNHSVHPADSPTADEIRALVKG